jgi:hypothetical protein
MASVAATVGRIARAANLVRRIGFVDLNLDNFHANVYVKIFDKELKHRGFSVAGATALEAGAGRGWAQKNNVPWFDDVEGLSKAVDVFAILAPSNPETHLELAKRVLPFGKSTFIDKTFAPNLESAERIFALADKYGTPIQTTSALRYTPIQQWVAKVGRERVRHVTTFSSGGSFDEYIVHPVEMVVSCLGPEAVRLLRRSESQTLVDFSGDRTATINLYVKSQTPYAAIITTDDASEYVAVDTTKLFVDAADAMLRFFETGQSDIDRRETLTIMRIIDAAMQLHAREEYVKLTA